MYLHSLHSKTFRKKETKQQRTHKYIYKLRVYWQGRAEDLFLVGDRRGATQHATSA